MKTTYYHHIEFKVYSEEDKEPKILYSDTYIPEMIENKIESENLYNKSLQPATYEAEVIVNFEHKPGNRHLPPENNYDIEVKTIRRLDKNAIN